MGQQPKRADPFGHGGRRRRQQALEQVVDALVRRFGRSLQQRARSAGEARVFSGEAFERRRLFGNGEGFEACDECAKVAPAARFEQRRVVVIQRAPSEAAPRATSCGFAA